MEGGRKTFGAGVSRAICWESSCASGSWESAIGRSGGDYDVL